MTASRRTTEQSSRRRHRLALLVLPPTVLALAAVPASGTGAQRNLPPGVLDHLSSAVVQRYLAAHPDQARVGAGLERLRQSVGSGSASAAARAWVPNGLVRFNADGFGLPQNEESVSACRSNPRIVLGGTNDYRGLVNPKGNFTGWYLSTDGGRSVTNEGLLPAVTIGGRQVPSGGDPVNVVTDNCGLYAADLNYPGDLDFGHLPAHTNGIGVYRTSVTRLANCPGGDAGSCWPTRRVVTSNERGHFLDKPWMDVGDSGSAGTVAWIVYTDFDFANPAFPGLFTNQIKAVRCDASLAHCTKPILLSGDQNSLQFGDVTIGPDGRTYVTWEEDNDLANNFQPPEHMRFWLRVAEPGSTSFGPMRHVARAPRNVGLALLHANSFRASTYPKNTVAMVGGRPRIFLTWEECAVRALGDSVCEEPQIKMRYSDNHGRDWSRTRFVSLGSDNYFPTIDTDPVTGQVAIAYYTSRYDPVFHNRQDVELATIDAATGQVTRRQRLTPLSNETEADPLLGSAFIGDYFEVHAQGGKAYVHFNANYSSIRLLGEGRPIAQQDNFLRVLGM